MDEDNEFVSLEVTESMSIIARELMFISTSSGGCGMNTLSVSLDLLQVGSWKDCSNVF